MAIVKRKSELIYAAIAALREKKFIEAENISATVIDGENDTVVLEMAKKIQSYVNKVTTVSRYIEVLLERGGGALLDNDLYFSVAELIYYDNVDFAEKLINEIVEKGYLREHDISIGTVRKTLAHARHAINAINKLSVEKDEKVILKERISLGPKGNINQICDEWGDYDLYENYSSSRSISTFDADFAYETEEKIALLKAKGFNIRVPTDSLNKIYYGESVRVCSFNADMYSIVDKDASYVKSAVGRMAKVVPQSILRRAQSRIPKAIFLPIPHAIDNYYHVLAEMIYPLRFAAMVDEKIPIVYSEDRLNLLRFFAKRLNIDFDRFISFRELEKISVDQALIIDKGSHYWGFDYFSFFNWSINKGRAAYYPDKLIYISRSRSRRSFTNELELEDFLRKFGAIIVHAENLSISDQIELFESAGCIIAPHGAGVTNIIFSNRRARLLEIFERNFVNPDFYLRTRHQNIKYAASIVGENGLDIKEFERTLLQLLSN
jgi:hypothetical protein